MAPADVADQIEAMLPGAVILEVAEDVASRRLTVLGEADVADAAEPSMRDLFEQYLTQVGTRGPAATRVLESFTILTDAIEGDSSPVLPGAEELEEARP